MSYTVYMMDLYNLLAFLILCTRRNRHFSPKSPTSEEMHRKNLIRVTFSHDLGDKCFYFIVQDKNRFVQESETN